LEETRGNFEKMKRQKPQKVITWIAGILTLSLTTFSFVLSFKSLTDLASQNKVSVPQLFPLVVEAAVIVFSLVTLSRSMQNLPTKYNWGLIICSSFLAGFFNVAHSYPDKLSMFMAAMPSLFLLLSFESFLSLLKFNLNEQNEDEKMKHSLIQEIKNLKNLLSESQQKLINFEKENATLKLLQEKTKENKIVIENKVHQRRQKVLKMLQQGKTQDEIANKLKVSKATVIRDEKELNGAVKSL
jgi:hypothetical protein